MHTQNYIALKCRVEKLRKVYLPKQFSPTGTYNDVVYEKVRAYKVLVHAEMEFYFEEIALIIAKKAYAKWCKYRKASTPLMAIVAYYSGTFPSLPQTHTGNRSDEDIDWRINKAYTEYNSLVRNNNGIKEKDILSIFLPIGVISTDIDEDLLIRLNSFGTERGQIVHSTRANQPADPHDALDDIENIMTLIDSFDEFLRNYREKV